MRSEISQKIHLENSIYFCANSFISSLHSNQNSFSLHLEAKAMVALEGKLITCLSQTEHPVPRVISSRIVLKKMKSTLENSLYFSDF
jgi:hypothetical protein